MANSVDPDHTPRSEASDQDQHCVLRRLIRINTVCSVRLSPTILSVIALVSHNFTGRTMRKHVWAYADSVGLGQPAQYDQGFHCPLTESLDTKECMNGEQRP